MACTDDGALGKLHKSPVPNCVNPCIQRSMFMHTFVMPQQFLVGARNALVHAAAQNPYRRARARSLSTFRQRSGTT